MKRLLLNTCCLIALALTPASLMAQTPRARAGAAPQAEVTPGIDCQARCNFEKQMVEGQPIDTRPTQLPGDHAIFPGQTRAPYHKTVDIKVTTLASDLDNPWAVAQLPSGRFLVTEKPGRMRLLNKDGSSYDTITDLPPILLSRPGGPAGCRAGSQICQQPSHLLHLYAADRCRQLRHGGGQRHPERQQGPAQQRQDHFPDRALCQQHRGQCRLAHRH